MNIIQLSGHLTHNALNMTASWPHYQGNIACFDLVTETGTYSCFAKTDAPSVMNLKKDDHIDVEGVLNAETGPYPPSVSVQRLYIHRPPTEQVTKKINHDNCHCAPDNPSASPSNDNTPNDNAPSSGEKQTLDKLMDFKFITL